MYLINMASKANIYHFFNIMYLASKNLRLSCKNGEISFVHKVRDNSHDKSSSFFRNVKDPIRGRGVLIVLERGVNSNVHSKIKIEEIE